MDWDAVDWRRVEDDVRRLRHRIFTATQAGDLKKVRNLQKLMLRSRANALCSVRRVTEINAGRKTAGVDGRVVLEAWEKAELATWLQQRRARVAPPAGQAGVHPEGERKTARTRDSRHRRSGASSPDGRCAGTRVGGPVRIQIVWISAGPRLPGRDAGDLRDRTRRDRVGANGRWTRTWPPHSTESIIPICSISSARSPQGG